MVIGVRGFFRVTLTVIRKVVKLSPATRVAAMFLVEETEGCFARV